MAVEIVTKEDLEFLRTQLMNDFKTLIGQLKQPSNDSLEGFKTSHVRKLLNCSVNKVYALRVAGKLRFKKVGGTIYYKREDIKKLLDDGF